MQIILENAEQGWFYLDFNARRNLNFPNFKYYLMRFLSFGIIGTFMEQSTPSRATLFKICDSIGDVLKYEGVNVYDFSEVERKNKENAEVFETWLVQTYQEISEEKTLHSYLLEMIKTICDTTTPQFLQDLFLNNYRENLASGSAVQRQRTAFERLERMVLIFGLHFFFDILDR